MADEDRKTLSAVARFAMDEPYLRMLFHDWLRSRSRFRRYSVPVDLLLIAIGLLFGVVFPAGKAAPVFVVLLVAAALGSAWEYYDRMRWFRGRRAAPQFGKEMEIRFSDDGVSMSGPLAQGTCDWAYFAGMTRGIKGLFLVPETGLQIYIPYDTIVPPQAVSEIEAKVATARNP